MAEVLDRLKDAFSSVARGADPFALYGNLYRAKVRAQRGRDLIDVEPEDDRIPQMAGIPLKVGVPGVEVRVSPGHYVMVGWEDRRPDRPFATTWSPGEGGTVPLKTTVHAAAVELGGVAVEAVIHGTTYVLAEKSWVAAQQAQGAALAALAAALALPAAAAIGGAAQAAAGAVAAVATAAAASTVVFQGGQYLSTKVRTQ
jgi:hypothetical protein